MEFGKIRQLLPLFGFFSVILASSNINNGSMSHVSNQTSASLGLYECSFVTEDHSGKEQIFEFIDEKKELIFIHFHLQNLSNIFPFESGAKIYKILNLVRTAGGYGNELLRLHPQFEQLSLGTLMFGVEHVDVQLKHMSSECFFNSTEEQVHKDLIAFATKEFRLLENSSSDQRICSMYVDNINGRAEFYYKCCFRNANFSFECRIIEKTFWVNILFFAMTFIYIVAFLYSPLLIPTSWYKKNVVTFTFSLSKTIFISFTKKDTKSNVDHNTYILTNKDKEHMDNFKSKVSVLDKTNNKDKASCVYWDIKEVKIRLQDTKKTSSTFVPGSMFHFLYRTFVECRVKDHEYVEECCDAKCCPCYEDLKWLSFLQLFVQIVFVFCLLIPWCLRVLFFYLYEDNDRIDREHFANKLNLEYPNVFQWNLTYSLKPDHSFFIMCYVLPFFTFFIKSSIKRVLDKAGIYRYAKDINELSKTGFKNVLIPCTECGIFGIVLCPIYLVLIAPYIIIRYILPYIPLVSTSFLLLSSFLSDLNGYAKKIFKKKPITKKAVLKFTVLLICYMLFLLSFATSLILCLEVIVFFLQILMYVAIGVILNASQVVTYVTFAGILIFYAYNSIRQVLNKYERFSQTVFKYIMRNLKDLKCGLKNIALQLKLTEDRNALEPAEDCIAPSQSIVVENNKIMLSSEMPFVFFDDHGKPSINEEVFFKMCHMNSNGAPGSLWGNYKKAFIHFFIIVLFLLLVATIVLAFGQSKGVTGTYLALATLGGGLIPLILRKYFFRSHDLCDCGTEQNLFWDEVKPMFTKYETSFEVDDIIGDIQNDPSFKNDSSENNEYKKINIKFPIESEDPTESDVPDQHKVIREVDTRV